MSTQLVKWSTGITLFLWLLWVFITYIGFHPSQLATLSDHPYLGLLSVIGLVALLSGAYSWRRLRQKKKWYFSFRGGYLILATLVLGLVAVFSFWEAIDFTNLNKGLAGFYFFANSLWYLLLLLFLGISMIALGSIVTEKLQNFQQHSLFSMAIGIMLLGVFSAFLGLVHMLYGILLWAVIIGAVVLKRQLALTTLKEWLWTKHRWRILHWWQLPVVILGLFYVSAYWVGSVKAFASGFDGAALYANLAQLVAQKNSLPGAYQAFGWSVVMSWGELLFGSLSMNILLSHFIYLPALALGYQLLRKWLKAPYALLSIVLVLSLPMFSFMVMVDEKIDLGLLLISLAAIYLVLQINFSSLPENLNVKSLFQDKAYYPFLLLGGLLGFAFSIKYTSVFLLGGILALLFYRLGKMAMFWGWLLFFSGFIFLSGFYTWGNLPLSTGEAQVLGIAMSLIGVGLMIFRLYANPLSVRQLLQGVLLLGVTFLLVFSPWAGKHFAERNYKFELSSFLYGKPDRIAIEVSGRYLSQKVNTSPFETGTLKETRLLTNDQTSPKSDEISTGLTEAEEDKGMIGNAKREELQRYLGYEKGILRYLTIPFDLSFNLNVPGLRHQEVSFFWLALFPILFLFNAKRWLFRGILLTIGGAIYLAASYWSLTEAGTSEGHITAANNFLNQYIQQVPAGNNSGMMGFWQKLPQPFIELGSKMTGAFTELSTLPAYLFIPLLLGLVFLLVLALKKQVKDWPVAMKETGIILLPFLFLWFLLANSISWYALLPIVILPSWFIYVLERSSKKNTPERSAVFGTVIGSTIILQLVFNTGLLMTSTQPRQAAAQMYNWPMVQYLCSGDLDQVKTLNLFNSTYSQIAKQVNQGRSSRIYRVNTYLQFHIDNNDTRVLEDNQLQKFDQITSLISNPNDFIRILKENDFEYVLYDLNTPSLDQTPELSLQAKCRNLLQILLTSPEVELVITDNYVAAPAGSNPIRLPNGQTAVAQPGLQGQIVLPGQVALFRIK
ncbi:hypothetical protein [Lewinella cohaerens]|uniref:hypothetical protein n=1 Tax=Lewinella cohaerens TaxID=70995 RepID=UPI000375C162|nr:hypothetical protein [Lewinella cohaerens]